METFFVGDTVYKHKGYPFKSTVVAVFRNTSGEPRLVCESLVIAGLLHIFSPSQMTHTPI